MRASAVDASNQRLISENLSGCDVYDWLKGHREGQLEIQAIATAAA